MTREGRKQIENLTIKLEAKYQEWIKAVDVWSNNQEYPIPSLPKMVEGLLNHLRGLDAKRAEQFEWMLIV